MIITPSAIAAPLKKERVRIRLEFGRHQTAADARGLDGAFGSFKPHIYVPEKAGLGEEDRRKEMAQMNTMLRSDSGGKALASHAESRCVLNAMEGFTGEEMRIAARHRPLGLYLAESGMEQDIWSFTFMLMDMGQSLNASAELLLKGEINPALEAAEAGLRKFVKPTVIERNEIIADGVERLLSEAPLLFPELPPCGEIRALVRYGTTHAALKEILESRGFSVETGRIPIMDFRGDMCLRLSRDFDSPLTREEGMRLLFGDFFNEAAAELETSEEAHGAAMKQAYESIGGEPGFLSMLASAALRSPELERCMESVKSTLAAMAGDIGGGMHG